MSASAIPLSRAIRFYEATIGKKAVMAITGAILFLFVIGHLIGNLQIYMGREQIDGYGELLHSKPTLLWAVRSVLLACVVAHIAASLQLWLLNRNARPGSYVKKGNAGSTYASRTMMWSGPMLLAFIVYHLLHFTTGQAHPQFQYLKVYDNMVAGFRQVPASIAYIVAMCFLGMHLYHGIWSMFQSLGFSPLDRLAAPPMGRILPQSAGRVHVAGGQVIRRACFAAVSAFSGGSSLRLLALTAPPR